MTPETVAWPALRAGLTAIFKSCAQIPAGGVVQSRDEPANKPDQKIATTLRWSLSEIVPVGQAEIRTYYDPEVAIPGDTYEPNPDDPEERLGAVIEEAHQNLRIVIEVVIECDHQSVNASSYGRNLMARACLSSPREAFAALGLGLIRVRELADDTFDGDDGRPVSAYACALEFNGASLVSDSPITTIENAVFAYTVT